MHETNENARANDLSRRRVLKAGGAAVGAAVLGGFAAKAAAAEFAYIREQPAGHARDEPRACRARSC